MSTSPVYSDPAQCSASAQERTTNAWAAKSFLKNKENRHSGMMKTTPVVLERKGFVAPKDTCGFILNLYQLVLHDLAAVEAWCCCTAYYTYLKWL